MVVTGCVLILLPALSPSRLSWTSLMSSLPRLLRQLRTPGQAQHPSRLLSLQLPPRQTPGGHPLFPQLLTLGVVRPPRRPLGTPGGLLPPRGPQWTPGVGPQPLQPERGPHQTHGEAPRVSLCLSCCSPVLALEEVGCLDTGRPDQVPGRAWGLWGQSPKRRDCQPLTLPSSPSWGPHQWTSSLGPLGASASLLRPLGRVTCQAQHEWHCRYRWQSRGGPQGSASGG